MSVGRQTLKGRVANRNDMSERCSDNTLLMWFLYTPSLILSVYLSVCYSLYSTVCVCALNITLQPDNGVMARDQIPLERCLPLCFPTVWTNEKHWMWVHYPFPSDIHHRHFIYSPVISNKSALTKSLLTLIKMVSCLRVQPREHTTKKALKGKIHARILLLMLTLNRRSVVSSAFQNLICGQVL